ncbi:beta-ketoacyl-[acyl-carrier-protein] synthase family protein [Thalassoroseus pseudoceratinae]|uniref:beta-ketoacyl-[acyl-carrier-protein] synthase family protein n=1 Tax=Thalassoroseus pseudoceratinae TaxID=2713176 RepID=UPI00141F9B19|nr:beta-ketoacyl-[acyl-carrier-protein] synthase family protein [Thalassoroseus pseudoceratinae]
MPTGRDTSQSVVITGVGVVSPIGIGNDPFWQSLVAGKSGVELIAEGTETPRLAARVKDFDPNQLLARRRKFLKVMPPAIQFGTAAATLAMREAGLARRDIPPERLGVVFGAGRLSTTPQELSNVLAACRTEAGEFIAAKWGHTATDEIAPLWLLRQLPNMPASHVSIEFDARGPSNTITSRDCGALLSIGEAVNMIERDAADCVIVGGCGSLVAPLDWLKLQLFDELSQSFDDPAGACRPFDQDRDGTVVGEGAAAFVLERRSHATKRGATVFAEVLGIGSGCDPMDSLTGRGMIHAVSAATRSSNLRADEIGHINTHGHGGRNTDCTEARALATVFGEALNRIPCVALKGSLGTADAGSGAMELASSLLALRERTIPPTRNLRHVDSKCPLQLSADAQPSTHPTAVVVSRTSAGQSAAVVIRGE